MSIEQQVGLLLEARLVAPITIDEFIDFSAGVRRLVRQATDRVVFCTDWRRAGTLGEDIMDPFIWMMRQDNPKVCRTAVLVPPKGSPQVDRMLAEAKSDNRRACTSPEDAMKYLYAVTTPAERRRLEQFLGS
jgi:hypothetical protein